jgi:hypothetical protein
VKWKRLPKVIGGRTRIRTGTWLGERLRRQSAANSGFARVGGEPRNHRKSESHSDCPGSILLLSRSALEYLASPLFSCKLTCGCLCKDAIDFMAPFTFSVSDCKPASSYSEEFQTFTPRRLGTFDSSPGNQESDIVALLEPKGDPP